MSRYFAGSTYRGTFSSLNVIFGNCACSAELLAVSPVRRHNGCGMGSVIAFCIVAFGKLPEHFLVRASDGIVFSGAARPYQAFLIPELYVVVLHFVASDGSAAGISGLGRLDRISQAISFLGRETYRRASSVFWHGNSSWVATSAGCR